MSSDHSRITNQRLAGDIHRSGVSPRRLDREPLATPDSPAGASEPTSIRSPSPPPPLPWFNRDGEGGEGRNGSIEKIVLVVVSIRSRRGGREKDSQPQSSKALVGRLGRGGLTERLIDFLDHIAGRIDI